MSTSDDGFPRETLEAVARARAGREAVQAEDPAFFAAVSSAMFRNDPMGIAFGDNTDEYDAEAGTVIPRLAACASVEDLTRVLHEEFSDWFGADSAGRPDFYRALAEAIWRLECERRG